MDFLSLERSKGGIENVLVITDHFSRNAQAFPTRNQTARTTARILFDQVIVQYGFPARLHSDYSRTQGRLNLKAVTSSAIVVLTAYLDSPSLPKESLSGLKGIFSLRDA